MLDFLFFYPRQRILDDILLCLACFACFSFSAHSARISSVWLRLSMCSCLNCWQVTAGARDSRAVSACLLRLSQYWVTGHCLAQPQIYRYWHQKHRFQHMATLPSIQHCRNIEDPFFYSLRYDVIPLSSLEFQLLSSYPPKLMDA